MTRIIAIALALSLAACGQPVNTAASQAVVSADSLYTAASAAGQQAVHLGKLDRDTFKTLDNRAYAALQVVRDARKGVGAMSLQDAEAALVKALADLNTAAGK